MTALVALVSGLGIGAGILLLALAIRGVEVLPRPAVTMSAEDAGTSMAWILAAVVAALATFAITGWPVLAVVVAAGVWWLRTWTRNRHVGHDDIERTEAIAAWAEMLRDNMAAAAGLEQALLATANHAPAALAVPIRRFTNRLDRMPLLPALVELGDDIDHPSGDLVVVSLANAVRMEARDLTGLLSRLAEFIRADVRMRQRIEVSRARLRTSALIVMGTTAFTAVFLFVFAPDMLEVYDTTAGQLWLIVVMGVFAVSGWLMRSLGQVETPGRFRARRAAIVSWGSGP